MMSDVKIKIYGAGSAGTHFTRAALQRGWDVTIVDPDVEAFPRMTGLYLLRYGEPMNGVQTYGLGAEPMGGYNIVIIASPPETHMPLLAKVVTESPRAILVEKPLCPPNALEQAKSFLKYDIPMYCGYTHLLHADQFSVDPVTKDRHYFLSVEFREAWSFVLKAHPWLKEPEDSYLGDWRRGGGALGEHSHAISMWQHIARTCGAGEVTRVSATVNYRGRYDCFANVQMRTEDDRISGYVIVDTESNPAIKQAHLTSDYSDLGSSLHVQNFGRSDFGAELDHIVNRVTQSSSPLNYKYGYLTAKVIAACHQSGLQGGKWVDVAP